MAKKKTTPFVNLVGQLISKYGPSKKPSRPMPKSPTNTGLMAVNPDKRFLGRQVDSNNAEKQRALLEAKRKATDALIAKNTPKQTKATEATRAKKFASLKKKNNKDS
jgi:hypothetical protein